MTSNLRNSKPVPTKYRLASFGSVGSRGLGAANLVRCDATPAVVGMMIMAVVFVVLVSAISGCTSADSHKVVSVSESSPRISPELIALYYEYSSQPTAARKEPFRTGNVLVRIIDDRVLVDAVASGDVKALKADLVELGLRDGVSFGRVVSGQLPISSIPALGELSSLRFARASAATIQEKPLSSMTPER